MSRGMQDRWEQQYCTWEELVPGPRFAMDSRPGLSWRMIKFSSMNLSGHILHRKKMGLTEERLPKSRTSTSAISCSDITTLNHELWTRNINTLHKNAEKRRTSGIIR
jgi:hypothetical protein